MSNFKLNIGFTTQQLQILYATGSNVVIGKSNNGLVPNVAWQVFKPFQANRVEFNNEYGIYVSETKIEKGAILSELSNVPEPAVLGELYNLEQSGVITGPEKGGIYDGFAIQNQYSELPYITTGLYQSAVVNGYSDRKNAISANPLLLQSTAVFEPTNTVYVWLQSNIISNSVVTFITSHLTEVKFENGVDSVNLKYDLSFGIFVPTIQSMSATITHIEPVL